MANKAPNNLDLTQRVIDGTGDMHHNLIDANSTVTYTNVTYDFQTCGWPVSGTVATQTTFKNGTINSETFTLSLPCGTATDPNGTKINLSNCLPTLVQGRGPSAESLIA